MKKNSSNKIKTIISIISLISSASLATNVLANNENSKVVTHTHTHTHTVSAKHAKNLKKHTNKQTLSASDLINKITRGEAKIDGSFKSVGGLTGYIISPKSKQGQPVIVYIPHDASYALFGNIIDSKGNNLSQADHKKFVEEKLTKQAYAEIHKMHYVVQGKDSAPHKMYIVMDPNCSYCHLIYKDLNKYVNNGKLQIRWIPVGFLRQNSSGKAAAILAGKDQAEMLKNLVLDETKFNMQKEQGGIKELKLSSDKNNLVNANAFKKVKENNEFFSKYNLGGTPAIFFIDKTSGKPVKSPMTYVPKEEAQLKLISQASSKYHVENKDKTK